VFTEVQRVLSGSREARVADTSTASSAVAPESDHSTSKISEFISSKCTQVHGKEGDELIDILLRLAQAKLRRFPGAHPTALTRENLREAFTSEYFIAIKSDGIRYVTKSPPKNQTNSF